MQGDPSPRALHHRVRPLINDSLPVEVGTQQLQWLHTQHPHQQWMKTPWPQLHLFGEKDALVPARAAAALRAIVPADAVDVIPSASHLFPLTHANAVSERIAFMLRNTASAESFCP